MLEFLALLFQYLDLWTFKIHKEAIKEEKQLEKRKSAERSNITPLVVTFRLPNPIVQPH